MSEIVVLYLTDVMNHFYRWFPNEVIEVLKSLGFTLNN